MHPTTPQQQQQQRQPQQQQQQRPEARVTDGGPERAYQMVADQPTVIQAAPAVLARPAGHAVTRTKAGKPQPQSAEWGGRCRELAWAHQLVGMAQPLGRGQFGDLLWRVPSQSQPGAVHTVRGDKHSGTLHCGCPAGAFAAPCGHVGAALFEGEMVVRLLDPREVAAGETSAEYRAYFAWRTGIALERLERAERATAEGAES